MFTSNRPPAPGGQPSVEGPASAAEVQARFNLTTLELSPQAKLILERTWRASEGAAKAALGTSTLPSRPFAVPGRTRGPGPIRVPDAASASGSCRWARRVLRRRCRNSF